MLGWGSSVLQEDVWTITCLHSQPCPQQVLGGGNKHLCQPHRCLPEEGFQGTVYPLSQVPTYLLSPSFAHVTCLVTPTLSTENQHKMDSPVLSLV